MSSDVRKRASVELPPVQPGRSGPLAQVIAQRRSVREFAHEPLNVEQLAELCWAGQGVTECDESLRAAPSAGALFPMTLYLADAEGVFEYECRRHRLKRIAQGDCRPALQAAAIDQSCVGDAPVCFVIAMNESKLAHRYGRWSERYCLLEAGHIAQNILLAAVALGLAAVPVGAFEDDEVRDALHLPASQHPVYLIPLGRPAGGR